MKLLENDVIRLRAPELADLDLIYIWENDTSLWKLGNTLSPYSKFTLEQFIAEADHNLYAHKQLRLMIELKESAITVGAVDLYDMELLHQRAAVGILIDQPFQRKGLASQTLFLLVQYAFHFLHLHQLYAYIPVANLPSRQLFMKCGFQSMGVLKDWISTAYGYADVEVVARVYDGKSETPG